MKLRHLLATGITVATVAASAALLAAPARASTIIYVNRGQSIQAAVDSASPGDTIQIAAGTYQQNVVITTNDITLQGAGQGANGTTLLPPSTFPNNFCADVPPGTPFPTGGGVCVFGSFDASTGTIESYVTGVHISGLQIDNFPGDGVAAFGTQGLRVDHVTVNNSGVYGMAVLASKGGVVTGNTINGIVQGGGAAMVLGYLPDSGMVFSDNVATNAQAGYFIYDVGDVAFTGNTARGGCAGAIVWDDNQPGDGQPVDNGNILIEGNTLADNDATCPALPFQLQPEFQGSGLLMIGTSNTVVTHNTVLGNVGQLPSSGGIVLDSGTPIGGLNESSVTVSDNTAFNNGPDDLVWDQQGSAVNFTGNDCGTSSPAGFCG